MTRRRRRLLGAFVLLGFAAVGVGRGERLPLAGGGWIETQGAWRIEGRRVVYCSPEGNLRSLAIAETALARSTAPDRARAGPVREYFSPEPVEIVSPPPAAPTALAHAAPRSPAPGCRLHNGGPADPPRLACPGEPAPDEATVGD